MGRQRGCVMSACLMSYREHRLYESLGVGDVFHSIQTPHSLKKNYSVCRILYESNQVYGIRSHFF